LGGDDKVDWLAHHHRVVGSQADIGWNFEAAFQTGATIIPLLLFALILEHREVLQYTAVAFGLRRVLGLRGGITNLGVVARSAVLAEVAALIGLAVPPDWYERPPGRIVAFIALAFLGWVIWLLLNLVLQALVAIAQRAQSEAGERIERFGSELATGTQRPQEAPGDIGGTSDTTRDGLDSPDGRAPEDHSATDIVHEESNDQPHP
jgi:hypothetical protein